MSAKLAVVVSMMLASTAGCFAPASEDDGPGGGSAIATAPAALSLDDGQPGPLDHPVPVFELPGVREVHDLQPYLDELKHPRPTDMAGCVVHYKAIWDPARGGHYEVQIVVCN
jgi:hypothetical protein